ncbi:MAG: putative metalloprotease CJM1_0395 family protein [Desulfuromonadaceae bacterium]
MANATQEPSSSAPDSAPNDTPAPQNPRARNGEDGANANANTSSAQSSDPDESQEDDRTDSSAAGSSPGMRGSDIPPAEQQEVQELKQRDQEVRTHEAAHAAVGGQYAGAPSLEYETGPDGKRYAVSGEVSIDLGKVKGDPQETIDKMEQVQAAAMAPAQPSAQDRRVASRAAQIAAQSRMDLRMEQSGAMGAQAQATSPFDIVTAGGEENPQNQAPRPAAAAPSIESLRWSGAIA